MITVIPFFISLLIGYFLSRLILNKSKSTHPFLLLFFSVGLGFGISSVITFFSFLLFNQFNPFVLFFSHLILLSALFIFYHCKNNQSVLFLPLDFKKILNLKNILLTLSALPVIYLLGYLTFIFALRCPYGEWDAWAVWNMKARFLILSGTSWQNLFYLHPFTQPDYPPLLPFMHVWLWTLTKTMFHYVPLAIGIIFTLSCGGLLFFGLSRYIKSHLALLAMGLLICLPHFIDGGTSQYADVILAYFLLASLISLVRAVRENDQGFFVLTGVFLGLMAFTKNEGMLISALIGMITIFYFIAEGTPNKAKNIKMLFRGIALTFPAIIIFKLFLAPPNKDILLQNLNPSSPFFNLEGCYMIVSSMLKQFIHPNWHYIWVIVGIAIVLDSRRYWYKEIKILTLFFIVFIVAVFFVYLTTTNFSLMWRLSRTLSRILFYLYPSILFLVFYVYGYEK